jgi:penicillin-binding protein 1A
MFGCLFKMGLIVALFFMIVGPAVLFGLFKSIEEQLPRISYDSYRPDLATKIYDCRDRLIAELHAEEKRSTLVNFKQLPRHLVNALVSIEDERFFNHYGLDFKRILGAIYADVVASVKAGKLRKVQGASTITQQLARNAFLTLKKTWTRKLKEMVLAIQIERKFTKEEIIELYFNEILYGYGVYGIHGAARFYFDKDVSELNIAESSMIAGLIKSPEYYSPYRSSNISKQRQSVVLRKMFELGYIDKATYDAEKVRPLVLRGRRKEKWKAPYFIAHIRKILLENYGGKMLYTGGLKVYTTLDMDMQTCAEEAIEASTILKQRPQDKFPSLNCALLAVDPRNGHIRAMVGGRDFEKSKFNRTVQAKRQPGSSFKPIVYATAMDYGIPPNRILNDEEVEFVNKRTGQIYKPQNYTKKFYGPVLLRTALEHSYNVVAVKLLTQIGIERVISYAKKLGVQSPLGRNLSLALGTSEMTMQELVDCYCVFANQGIRIPSYAIRRIVDPNGNIIFENNPPEREVISPQTAFVMTDMMTGVMKRGTGRSARLSRPCAGKTGTTSDYRDAWFVGYVPQLVTSVYVGNDDFTPLGGKLAGGVVSGPIWKHFMTNALKAEPELDFQKPRNVALREICEDSGLLATKYCKSRIEQAFIEGTEPVISCNLHELIEVFGDGEQGFDSAPFGDSDIVLFKPDGDTERVYTDAPVNEDNSSAEERLRNLFDEEDPDVINRRKIIERLRRKVGSD